MSKHGMSDELRNTEAICKKSGAFETLSPGSLRSLADELDRMHAIVERLAESTQALIDYCDLSHELPIGMREIVDNARDCLPAKTHHNCRCESPDVDGDGICPNCGDDADYGHMDEHTRAAAEAARNQP